MTALVRGLVMPECIRVVPGLDRRRHRGGCVVPGRLEGQQVPVAAEPKR